MLKLFILFLMVLFTTNIYPQPNEQHSNSPSQQKKDVILLLQRDAKKNLYGYYGVKNNKNLGYVIKPKFENAYSFYDNKYAWVRQNGLWGIINSKGKYVMNAQYDGLKFADKHFYIVKKNNKYGIVDIELCKEIVTHLYDSMQYVNYDKVFTYKNRKWQILNISTGEDVVNDEYDAICSCNDSIYLVYKENKQGLVSLEQGSYILPPLYNSISTFNGNPLLKIINKEGLYGLCNISSHDIMPCQYDSISYKPLYLQCFYTVRKDSNLGIINTNILNKEVIECEYQSIKSLHEQYCIVQKDAKYGVVDLSKSSIVLPCEYDSISLLKHPYYTVMKGNLCGVADLSKSSIILPCEYNEVEYEYINELIIHSQNSTYGITKVDGEQLFPTTIIKPIVEDLVCNIHYNQKTPLITTDGECYIYDGGAVLPMASYLDEFPEEDYEDYKVKSKYNNLFCRFDYFYITENTNYEEKKNGDIYTHICKGRYEIAGYEINLIKHYIDQKHYLYRTSFNELQKFCIEDLIEVDDEFQIEKIGFLSNGDYLIETSGVDARDIIGVGRQHEEYVKLLEEYVHPMFRDKVSTKPFSIKYQIIIDDETFTPKGVISLPGNHSLLGVSRYDGWYVMGLASEGYHYIHYSDIDAYIRSRDHWDCNTIYKISNEGNVQWAYNASMGEGVKKVSETPYHVVMSGWTTNKGYIDYYNPMLVYVDKDTGERQDMLFYIAKKEHMKNLPYTVKDFLDNGIQLPMQPKEIIVQCDICGISVYGLQDHVGGWLIRPVVIGSSPQTYGDWTIYPPKIDANGNIDSSVSTCVINKHKKQFQIKNYEEEIQIKNYEEEFPIKNHVVGARIIVG